LIFVLEYFEADGTPGVEMKNVDTGGGLKKAEA